MGCSRTLPPNESDRPNVLSQFWRKGLWPNTAGDELKHWFVLHCFTSRSWKKGLLRRKLILQICIFGGPQFQSSVAFLQSHYMEVFFLSKYEPSGKHHNVCFRKLITSITLMVQLISPGEISKGLSFASSTPSESRDLPVVAEEGTCARRWCDWTRWCSSARLNDPQSRQKTYPPLKRIQSRSHDAFVRDSDLSYLLDCFWQTLPLKKHRFKQSKKAVKKLMQKQNKSALMGLAPEKSLGGVGGWLPGHLGKCWKSHRSYLGMVGWSLEFFRSHPGGFHVPSWNLFQTLNVRNPANSPVEVGSWNPSIYRVLYIPGG